jgi:SpoVK/Ycf46/Vps4 family AAA+-type ATPase
MDAMDPKVLQPVLRDAFHPAGYASVLAEEVLGKDIQNHGEFSKTVPWMRWPLWGVAFEDMTNDPKGAYKREKAFGSGWDFRERPPKYSMVSVGLNKERAVPSGGGVVISKDKTNLIVTFEGNPEGMSINVLTRKENKAEAEKFFSALQDWIAKNNFYRGQKISASGKFLDLSDVSEADLILPADIKREIFRNVKNMIEKWEDYTRFGIPGKRGVILAGPPGNGKSLSMKVLAKSLGCTFIWVTPKDVIDRGFSSIYDFARELAPSVVLLEDADSFGLDRRLGGFNPVLGELLNIMDGFVENKGVVTVLSSNYVEVLDSALTHRPGRFDTKILLGSPGPNETFELFRRTMEKRKVIYSGDVGFLKILSNQMAGARASGAYIVEAVNYAMMLAVERGRGRKEGLFIDGSDLKDSVERMLASIELTENMSKSVAGEGVYKWGAWTAMGKGAVE